MLLLLAWFGCLLLLCFSFAYKHGLVTLHKPWPFPHQSSPNGLDPCTCKLPSTEKLPLLAAELSSAQLNSKALGFSARNEQRIAWSRLGKKKEKKMLVLGLATGCCFLAGEVKKQEDGGGASSPGEDGSRISPAVVLSVVILAVVLFVSGLFHLLIRFLLRRSRARARGEAGGGEVGAGGGEESALQRQLQQLFHLHDAGLDQDVIDALPVFLYREVVGAGAGAKEPFDCAVCLCEFAGEDRLRLLPLCGHAFHINCIDTWLLSNSTCPLCRCALGADAAALFDAFGEMAEGGAGWKHEDAVLPVRLGKFKNLSRAVAGPVRDGGAGAGIVTREAGETSSSSLDARRCYSMGSYQYVLAEANLQVSVHRKHGDGNGRAAVRPRGVGSNPAGNEASAAAEGKRIGAGSKGDSFSVSKIWQWPRNGKGKLPVLASDDSPAMNGRLPWQRRSPGDS
ncbi:RING-H2 finger protein ATL46-like [Phragmites australis]|uniref:RING-H2 finger protein ATL46-like n=1 Tax=Phragmites australis TaxID=29695 RepID=UPI002D77F44D|nr:RING-H2 finger protein ATL46-like [Phragmites australis]